MEFIAEHYQWVFSGIGVFAIGLAVSLYQRSKSNSGKKMNQKSGSHSVNIQIDTINNDLGEKKDE